MTDFCRQTRRSFIKTVGGTVVLLTHPLPGLAALERGAAGDTGEGWSGQPGAARWRIEGLAKVTGQKIYARDFRARDMAGWPAGTPERAAMVLRAPFTDRVLLNINLYGMPYELLPMRVIDAETLHQNHIQPPFPETPPAGGFSNILVPFGEKPAYFGQPVAILIFRDEETRRAAQRYLQFRTDFATWGGPTATPPVTVPYEHPTYLTRYVEDGEELFSQVKDGPSNPYEPGASKANEHARDFRERIEQDLANQGWRVFSGETSTQRLDPLFMEPEAGIAWFDRNARALHLVLGTQASNSDMAKGVSLFCSEGCDIDVKTVHLTACFPGGGFGGRDESPFSTLLILAAAFTDGPVRLAYDRYEQFQAGLKRAGAGMRQTLAVDAEGRFQATVAHYEFEAGGRNNYSQFVAELGAYSAGGGYRIPRAAVDAGAYPTDGVVAGSMRGFGGPAACFALETLIDHAAAELGRDAIALRRMNALQENDHTVTGAPLTETMRIAEICDRAAANPLWLDRGRAREDGLLRGVGFALANQAYGTGKDGVMGAVAVDLEGRLTVATNCVDMGNGSATTLAIATGPILGANAHQVRMGDVDAFAPLANRFSPPGCGAPSHHKSHHARRPADDEHWDDPDWTAGFALSSSACLTAFHQVHAVRQAAQVLRDTGLWPGACRLWNLDPDDDAARNATRWASDGLTLDGRRPLALAELARAARDAGAPTAAQVHAFYEGDWVSADYAVGGRVYRWPIDGLALGADFASSVFMPRSNTKPPPQGAAYYGRSLYAPSATLAAVSVDPALGTVKVTDVYSYLDAGTVLQPDLLSGQYQGAVAMGVGSALLENLPVGAEGAGRGNWNLDRYHPALAGDLPLGSMRLELLPPLHEGAPSKGIAEAVLSPLAPAIANAVAAATGRRFDKLPITPDKVRAALGHG